VSEVKTVWWWGLSKIDEEKYGGMGEGAVVLEEDAERGRGRGRK